MLTFARQVRAAGAVAWEGRPPKETELLFYAVERVAALDRLGALEKTIRRDGAI